MITLNGVKIPDFVKVNSVDYSVLPPIQNNLMKVRGKAGSYLFSQDLDSRVFTVYFTIIADEINGVMAKSREYAEWLYHDEPVKLTFADEPDKHYLVVPDGDSSVSEILNIGQGAIEFVCIEPFAYGEEITKEIGGGKEETTVFEVGGNVDTRPQLTIVAEEDITSLSVQINDNTVTIGEPAGVSSGVINPTPVAMLDRMQTLEGWGRGFTIDGGSVHGEFDTDGSVFYVKDNDYGTGEAWHGPSLSKSLDRPIQDFNLHFGFRLDTSGASNQIGRVTLYLLDEDDVQFGKISLVDNRRNATMSDFEALAGTWEGGHFFAKADTQPEWSNYYGRILLSRHGRKWEASISPDGDGRYIRNYKQEWFDSTNQWGDYKLAKVQVHIGAYGNYPPPKRASIQHIHITERLTMEQFDVPIIAIVNDVIEIDNEKMVIYLNGEPRYDLINPASNFLSLQGGENSIKTIPSDIEVVAKYTERWI